MSVGIYRGMMFEDIELTWKEYAALEGFFIGIFALGFIAWSNGIPILGDLLGLTGIIGAVLTAFTVIKKAMEDMKMFEKFRENYKRSEEGNPVILLLIWASVGVTGITTVGFNAMYLLSTWVPNTDGIVVGTIFMIIGWHMFDKIWKRYFQKEVNFKKEPEQAPTGVQPE